MAAVASTLASDGNARSKRSGRNDKTESGVAPKTYLRYIELWRLKSIKT